MVIAVPKIEFNLGLSLTVAGFVLATLVVFQNIKLSVGSGAVQAVVAETPMFEAMQRTLQVADDLGWEVVAENPAKGLIQATTSRPLFGSRDQVLIHVQRLGPGSSKIDIEPMLRSSRLASPNNIQFFLDRLQKRLRD